jgi:ABC-type phosphate transport system auxiliary subunit
MQSVIGLAVVAVVAVLAISGSILVWPAQSHDLGHSLIGAAAVIGVVYSSIMTARSRRD